MTEALVISNVLLWLAVLVLAGVVLALVRQIGVLHERIAPAGALMGGELPQVGQAGPELELEDWTGTRQRIGGVDPEGRSTLLFFVSPTCPVCKQLLPTVHSLSRAEGSSLRVVLASDGTRAEHEPFVAEHGLDRGIYVLSGRLGVGYQVGRLPYAILLDDEGVVRARGLVNSREHLESLFEAKDRGVSSVQEFLGEDAGSRVVAGGKG